jgi:hypothetical protein
VGEGKFGFGVYMLKRVRGQESTVLGLRKLIEGVGD